MEKGKEKKRKKPINGKLQEQWSEPGLYGIESLGRRYYCT